MAQTQAMVAEPVDREFVEDFMPRWLEAWNSHDADRVLALMAEDIAYDDASWPVTMRGHAEVRPFLDFFWRAFPDVTFEPVGRPLVSTDETTASIYWLCRGTFGGPMDPPGFAPTGRRMELEGADFHNYRDGKVVRLRIVFDNNAVARQLGMLPESGSRAERLGVKLINLRNRLRRLLGR
jgi:steroid delta-isomerase-like uncharacterized protein